MAKEIIQQTYGVPTILNHCGVNKTKVQDIIAKLGPLMKKTRLPFYNGLLQVAGLDNLLDTHYFLFGNFMIDVSRRLFTCTS